MFSQSRSQNQPQSSTKKSRTKIDEWLRLIINECQRCIIQSSLAAVFMWQAKQSVLLSISPFICVALGRRRRRRKKASVRGAAATLSLYHYIGRVINYDHSLGFFLEMETIITVRAEGDLGRAAPSPARLHKEFCIRRSH